MSLARFVGRAAWAGLLWLLSAWYAVLVLVWCGLFIIGLLYVLGSAVGSLVHPR